MSKYYDICGVMVESVRIRQINKRIIDHALKPYTQPYIVFKPYVEFLSRAVREQSIQNLLNQADSVIADATSVQWAGAYLYGKPNIHTNLVSTFWSLAVRLQSKRWRTQIFPEKMGGVDMTLPLLKELQSKKLKVGILGGPKDTVQTKDAVLKIFPGLNLTVWNGFYPQSHAKVMAQDIARHKLDVLFVAMGFPKQERFIAEFRNTLQAKVLIGEGGSFDYDQLGGKIKRAPGWMRKIGLEWLWRLFRQPKRFKRQLAIPHFIFAIRAQKKHQS